MPYISTRTNRPVSAEEEKKLVCEMGKMISILPGKSEQWLMTDFSGGCRLSFGGKSDEGIAFISVRIFGEASEKDKDKLTEKLTELVGGTLQIPSRNIYVQYESCQTWGWNGSNF